MSIPSIYNSARDFADQAHKEVGDTYGEHEYVFHLDYAFDAFLKFPPNKAPDFNLSQEAITLMIGNSIFMHDVIEDTKKTKEDITQKFDLSTALSVQNLSNIEGKTRKETIQLTLQKYSTFKVDILDEYISLVVKPYDRYANFNYSVQMGNERKAKMYFDEHNAFKRATYREGIADLIWDELDKVYAKARDEFGFIDESVLSIKKSLVKKYDIEAPQLGKIEIMLEDRTLTVKHFDKIYSHTWNVKSLANFIISNNTDYLIEKLAPMIDKYEEDFETFKSEIRQKMIELRRDESIGKELARTIYDVRDWSNSVSSNPYEPLVIDYYDKEELASFTEYMSFDVPERLTGQWLRMEKIIKIVKLVLAKDMN